jgi:aspartyl-tRNA(Asn)/glutamyl-tRNA(Gln) amidotransferase subunit A
MTDALHFQSISELSRRIQARELSPVELTDAFLDRITRLDSQINAFVLLDASAAREQARAAEVEIMAGRWRGPLHGVPFAVKDIYDVAGLPTTGCSRIASGQLATQDAPTVACLRAAGAVLLGKCTTHELAHGGPSFDLAWPPARNPWQPEHYTGGSSSGSGAAVAAGFVPLALGSDTGGSIRTPALLCGTVGLKPTAGLLSRRGVMQNSVSFDYSGVMTWTVEDCAISLQALAIHDPVDHASMHRSAEDYRAAMQLTDLRGLRIGVVRHFWEEDMPANAELRAAMEVSLDVLRRLGATVEDTRMRSLAVYYGLKLVIAETEIFSVYQHELSQRPDAFGGDFLWKALPACLFQSADYVQAHRERQKMVRDMQPLYERYDVLVTAGAGPAMRLDAYRPMSMWQKPLNYATPFNVTGGPVLALCNGYSDSGLPLGMQIAGRPFDEAMVFRVAAAYERATNWRTRRPVLHEGVDRVPVIVPDEFEGVERASEAALREADGFARRAGLRLSEQQLRRLAAAMPYALEMAQRIPRQHALWEQSATLFYPGWGTAGAKAV